MSELAFPVRFSLLGGPLHRLGARLGLVRHHTQTLSLGFAISALLWVPLVVIALAEGGADRLFSLTLVAAHVRLLGAIPLFFLCESWLDPPAATFIRTLLRSGIVPSGAATAFERTLTRAAGQTNSRIPDLICLACALLVSVYSYTLPLAGSTAIHAARDASADSLAADWYWSVCLPLFRFLMFRWVWRMGVWAWLLWRVSRLDLDVRVAHPDGAAGLSYLEVVHSLFTPLVFAFSAIQSAALAEELSRGAPFAIVYSVMGIVLLIDAALFLGPLFVFAPKVWASRIQGLAAFTELGERYIREFDAKWLRARPGPQEPLLGTPDVQALADFYDTVAIARNVRVVPIGLPLLWRLGAAAAVPALPLLLFEYPIHTLAQKILTRLVGL